MDLTAASLRAREDRILDALESAGDDKTFFNRLYRDGVPTPQSYLAQSVRVLFVFREPNMGGLPYALDMRDEVHDERFRPIGRSGKREERSARCWWNAKAGMFAHAVTASLDRIPAREAFDHFLQVSWNHEVVNRHAYIQIKKVGGGGTAKAAEICDHAARYADTLKKQVELYKPHLVLGGGVGRDAPARLLAKHVLVDGRETRTQKTGARWWRFPMKAYPRAMVQLWHPAWRGSRWTLYEDVWSSVGEVAKEVSLV